MAQEKKKDIFSLFSSGKSKEEILKEFNEEMNARRKGVAAGEKEYFTKGERKAGRKPGEPVEEFKKRTAPPEDPFKKSGAPTPTLFGGTPAGSEDIPTKTKEQSDFMNNVLKLVGDRLTPLLEQMGKSPKTEMSGQLEQMFGHMNNPILQGLMNQGYRQNAQVLFPSQLAQQGSGTLEALLGGLAQHYAPQAADYGYDLAAEYLPRAYESARALPGQIGGGMMNILSALGNKFRPAQQLQQ